MCLQMKNISPEIIFLSPKKIIQHEMSTQLSVLRVGVNSGQLWEQLDLVIFLSSFKDYVLINLANTGPICIRQQVITIHDLAVWDAKKYYHPFFVWWYKLLISRLVKKVLGVFTVSETEKMNITQRFMLAETQVFVTYNGLASSMIKSSLPLQTGKDKIILYVGSVVAKKNIDLLVDSFLKSNLSEGYQLYLVGRKGKMMDEVNVQLDKQIIWLQDLSDEELVKLYQRAECFVSLSESEGFGIPVLEALYFGCKVLCADIPVNRELYNHYAYFCNPKNQKEVLAKMESLPNAQLPTKNQISLLLDKYNYTSSAYTMLHTLQKICSR